MNEPNTSARKTTSFRSTIHLVKWKFNTPEQTRFASHIRTLSLANQKWTQTILWRIVTWIIANDIAYTHDETLFSVSRHSKETTTACYAKAVFQKNRMALGGIGPWSTFHNHDDNMIRAGMQAAATDFEDIKKYTVVYRWPPSTRHTRIVRDAVICKKILEMLPSNSNTPGVWTAHTILRGYTWRRSSYDGRPRLFPVLS